MSSLSVLNVASEVLERLGLMTTWKLQKLVYYCQAWSLVWDEKPLFDDSIEAWANGPVAPTLYREHKGAFTIDKLDIEKKSISDQETKTIDAVIKYYGNDDSQTLSELTHRERPWIEARKGLAMGERGDRVITHESMAEYYSSLI